MHMSAITTRSAGPISPKSHDPQASFGVRHKGVFRKEGDYWSVGYEGDSARLKDARGFRYVAHLLRHPGTEFHVLDLYGRIVSQREDNEISQSINGSPRQDLENAGIQGSISPVRAMMLKDRGHPADRAAAQRLLTEALENYQKIGMPRHSEITQRLMRKIASLRSPGKQEGLGQNP
jgi:hypothetical protein